ncbi:hypothetical protein CR205_13360 [Alteribacter lacisalsi]|uniref:DUF3108 domain-containing protein n=1 Tax=Alteribacter lacisalsi TaxID=2045244 RepID=A0A2W0HI83_9BACI|nr:hypothetical protein [Alteribacter lacisalsi]PYZ96682.1 hypothetical protein CR205_13360 [Alteribacter lacisalsi]
MKRATLLLAGIFMLAACQNNSSEAEAGAGSSSADGSAGNGDTYLDFLPHAPAIKIFEFEMDGDGETYYMYHANVERSKDSVDINTIEHYSSQDNSVAVKSQNKIDEQVWLTSKYLSKDEGHKDNIVEMNIADYDFSDPERIRDRIRFDILFQEGMYEYRDAHAEYIYTLERDVNLPEKAEYKTDDFGEIILIKTKTLLPEGDSFIMWDYMAQQLGSVHIQIEDEVEEFFEFVLVEYEVLE